MPEKKNWIEFHGSGCDYMAQIPSNLDLKAIRGAIADHEAEWDYWNGEAIKANRKLKRKYSEQGEEEVKEDE